MIEKDCAWLIAVSIEEEAELKEEISTVLCSFVVMLLAKISGKKNNPALNTRKKAERRYNLIFICFPLLKQNRS